MRWQRFNTPTVRLTATYIAIIMTMSIGFSIIFHNTSYRQLGRQLPPRSVIDNQPVAPAGDINSFLQQRIREGRKELLNRLIILNVAALVGGSILSYALARRQLEPIEAAMEAQAQFVSDASHELRTPLTALQVTNEVALRKPKLSKAEINDLLEHNIAEAVALRDLSNALLGLVKPDETVAGPVHLQSVVTDAINHCIPIAQSKRTTIEDKVSNVMVKSQPTALSQVITILLDNAIKYGHEGGAVNIEAHKRGRDVIISVRDNGPGIDRADLPHIFERFYRADKSRVSEGYGLGLAIAKRIVEHQSGSIRVISSGDGTEFSIKLPAA